MMEMWEGTSAMTERRRGRTPGDIHGFGRGEMDESISAWPHGLREKIETVISGEGPGPAREEKEVY